MKTAEKYTRNTQPADGSVILADGHVHLYDFVGTGALLDGALANFHRAAPFENTSNRHFVLFLTEGKNYNRFATLHHWATNPGSADSNDLGPWTLCATGEATSLIARQTNRRNSEILLVAGRQVISAENLEVLALFRTEPMTDGLPLAGVMTAIRDQDGLPVIAWGAGKWLGKRGRTLTDLLDQDSGPLLLGDNGGRPGLLPEPAAFDKARKLGIGILPGSDPLPIADDHLRIGSFGFMLRTADQTTLTADSLKKMLFSSSQSIIPYGHLAGTLGFLRAQILLRLHRRR